MSSQEIAAPKDWKVRYLDLIKAQAQEKAEAAETEKLLCRIIIRLTLATSGLDPVLDPHLVSLRNTVRKGVQPELKERLTAISEALIRAEDPADTAAPCDAGLLSRIVDRSGVSGRKLTKLRKLVTQLLAAGDEASDEQIDRFLELLTDAGAGGDRQRAPGLLGRLFGASGATAGAASGGAVTPNQQLIKLLNTLDWPSQFSLDIQRMEMELAVQQDSTAWMEVLTSLLRLLSRSVGEVETEIRDTRGFLTELTKRLEEIDKHVSSNKDLRQASREERDLLGESMERQVGDMRHYMSSATTLSQLRSEISQHLEAIESHVGSYLVKEAERHEEAERLEVQLRKRLEEVQKESRELRTKMIEAHRQAATDTVTGLPNRLAYEERLAQEFARWKRFGEPLTLLIWDVDDFKRINDRFGHHAGDKALHIIGQSLQTALRETDFVARFGGEEFVMLLTGTQSDDALNVAEAVRREVKQSGIHSLGNRVDITISCGMSQFVEGDNPAAVFARADKALYEAKRSGKDRIVVH